MVADGTTLWIDRLCEGIIVANAPNRSVDSHYVCRLKKIVQHISGLSPTICGLFLCQTDNWTLFYFWQRLSSSRFVVSSNMDIYWVEKFPLLLQIASLFVVFIILAVFGQRKTWISTEIIMAAALGSGMILFPRYLLSFQVWACNCNCSFVQFLQYKLRISVTLMWWYVQSRMCVCFSLCV